MVGVDLREREREEVCMLVKQVQKCSFEIASRHEVRTGTAKKVENLHMTAAHSLRLFR